MWVSLLQAFLVMVASSALTALLAPKPEKPKAGQLDIPTASEGDQIIVVFGTNLIKQSNVIWYGNPFTRKVKTKNSKK